MVIDCLRQNDISILTHPGDKGPFDIRAIAEVCVETDTLMEINTWHGHMTEEEIREYVATGEPMDKDRGAGRGCEIHNQQRCAHTGPGRRF